MQHLAEQGSRLSPDGHQAATASTATNQCRVCRQGQAGLCLSGKCLVEMSRGESVRGARCNGKGWERLEEGHAKFDSVFWIPGFAWGEAGLETVPGLGSRGSAAGLGCHSSACLWGYTSSQPRGEGSASPVWPGILKHPSFWGCIVRGEERAGRFK